VGTAAPAVIDELARAAEPGLMGMTGPGFFGWVIGASHPVGVAADWLTSIWGQGSALQVMLFLIALIFNFLYSNNCCNLNNKVF
jgi:hypothetical protein